MRSMRCGTLDMPLILVTHDLKTFVRLATHDDAGAREEPRVRGGDDLAGPIDAGARRWPGSVFNASVAQIYPIAAASSRPTEETVVADRTVAPGTVVQYASPPARSSSRRAGRRQQLTTCCPERSPPFTRTPDNQVADRGGRVLLWPK
jgi:hypothetical protein